MNFVQAVAPYGLAVAYLIFLLGYSLYSIYAIHHLNEFGYSGDASQTMLRFYIAVSSIVLLTTAITVLVGFFT